MKHRAHKRPLTEAFKEEPRCEDNFFAIHNIADAWNRLPVNVVEAPMIISFKQRLDLAENFGHLQVITSYY